MPLRANSHLKEFLLDKTEPFKQPLLPRSSTRDQLEYLQRLCGKNSQQAMNIAMELTSDMERGTYYPPAAKGTMSSGELSQLVHQLVDNITSKKQEAAAATDKK